VRRSNIVQTRLSIGVVGAGTAGTAAAILLARAGHRVVVYERVAQPGPVGAGIVLQPSGQAALATLGLLAPVLERGAAIHRLRCVNHRGRSVLDLNYASLSPDAFGLGLHRGVLFSVLFAAANRQSDLDLRCGVEIERAVTDAEGRSHLVTADGRHDGPYDLVVVADGTGSKLRKLVAPRARVYPYAWGAMWFVGDDPNRIYRDELFQVVRGTHHMVGFLPTGLGPSGTTPQVSLYFSIRLDRVDAFRSSGFESFRRTVLGDDPRARTLVEQIQSPDALLSAAYAHVALNTWHGPGTVLLGDSGHAMSPQLGQGSNLALVDATVLAECLQVDQPLQQALAHYSRVRRAHLRYYQWATRSITPWFQSNRNVLGWLRDVLMPLGQRLPWFRRQMGLSMAGGMRGLLHSPLPIPLAKALPAPIPMASATKPLED